MADAVAAVARRSRAKGRRRLVGATDMPFGVRSHEFAGVVRACGLVRQLPVLGKQP